MATTPTSEAAVKQPERWVLCPFCSGSDPLYGLDESCKFCNGIRGLPESECTPLKLEAFAKDPKGYMDRLWEQYQSRKARG